MSVKLQTKGIKYERSTSSNERDVLFCAANNDDDLSAADSNILSIAKQFANTIYQFTSESMNITSMSIASLGRSVVQILPSKQDVILGCMFSITIILGHALGILQ